MTERNLDAALEAVRRRFPLPIRVGIILGTGLGQLADHIEAQATVSYREIPGFPHSTALSHKGSLVCGQLAGLPVAAMQGRCHLYEGYSAEQLALPVKVLQRMGAELLIVSNASGGINPSYRTGELVVIEDHINLMWDAPRPGDRGSPGPPIAGGRPYTPSLVDQAMRVARRENFTLHPGVYVGVTGPNYETRAEYRMFRRMGGDVVGMSTVPEVLTAAHCGLNILALSMVTNVARPDAPDKVDADDVVQVAQHCEPRMRQIVLSVLKAL